MEVRHVNAEDKFWQKYSKNVLCAVHIGGKYLLRDADLQVSGG
jgi:hypothetical protein